MKHKFLLYLAILLSSALLLSACSISRRTKVSFDLKELHSGDAKYFRDAVATSVGGVFTLYRADGTLIGNEYGILSNWIGVCEEDSLVLYANGNKETGIASFGDDYQLLANTILLHTENLFIDPCILKIVEGRYYLSLTEIDGNVNNADPASENGFYTVHFYEYDADDGILTELGSITEANNNLEDGDLFFLGDTLFYLYEKEVIDRGPSSIELARYHAASGLWETAVTLLPAEADQEPAALLQSPDGGYRLYYSSDADAPGTSYMGGRIYCAQYDSEFSLLGTAACDLKEEDGILLYDVKEENNALHFLYCRNYMTDCDLVSVQYKE